MRFLIALLLASLLPAALQAACTGEDLRDTLDADARADLARYVDTTPYPVGNHWIATRGDDKVHVIGTLHLDDPRLDGPTARLRPVVEGAAMLLLETTKTEEARLKERLATDPSIMLLEGATLPELIDEEAWQALSEAASARGVPGFMAAKLKPWYLAILLSTPPCAKELLNGANGLDARLQRIAIEADVPRQALEPYDTIFSLFDTAPLPQQIEMMQGALVPPETSEDLLATLLQSYFSEDHAEGWEVSRLLSIAVSPLPEETTNAAFADMQENILDARNRKWIPVIEEALAPPYIVVAAGGAHLHGPEGVLNLLAEAGFTLERAEF